ncbi:MAG: hypothetical protein M1294_10510 [Firmicutes bacterium]|nr:hypothetical protein [Bacillota bacterium]MCL5015680.1 hypothetical protein [Bacillota bacterium]
MNKTLAFFQNGQIVPMTTPIFQGPKTRRRGRRREEERHFPNGELIPSREELIQYILSHVLYQIDPVLGEPVFCKHIIKPNRERNRESMYHVVLGPPSWTGVWEVIGNRRMFDIHAEYVKEECTWLPQITVSRGNFIGVENLNGIELDSEYLRREIIGRNFVTPDEYDWFASPYVSVRRMAVANAERGIWM